MNCEIYFLLTWFAFYNLIQVIRRSTSKQVFDRQISEYIFICLEHRWDLVTVPMGCRWTSHSSHEWCNVFRPYESLFRSLSLSVSLSLSISISIYFSEYFSHSLTLFGMSFTWCMKNRIANANLKWNNLAGRTVENKRTKEKWWITRQIALERIVLT